MRRYVQLATSFWIDTQDWPRNARYLFLYLWSNDHVDGVTGVGHIPDPLVRIETGLTPKALENAWEFLVERKKVVRDSGWYWIVDRAKHTCLREDGKPHARMAPAARSRMGEPSVPEGIRKPFKNTYRILFDNLSNTSPRGHARAVSRKPLAVDDSVDDTEKGNSPGPPLPKISKQALHAYEGMFGPLSNGEHFAVVTGPWKAGTMKAVLKKLGTKKIREMKTWRERRRLSYLRSAGDNLDTEAKGETAAERTARLIKETAR